MIEALESFAQWLLDIFLWVPRKVWDGLLDGLAGVIEAIPPPDFMNAIAGYAAAVPSGVVWGLEMFAFAEGMGMIAAALLARFLLRRIPLIG